MTYTRFGAPLAGLLLLAGLALPPAAAAQAPIPDRQVLLDRHMGELERRLALTPDQAAKVRSIQDEHLRRMQDLLSRLRAEDDRRGRLALARQAQSLRQEAGTRMAAVLSPAQMQAYETLLAEQQAEMRDRVKARRDGS